MMRRLSQRGRVLKWAGLVLVIAFLLVWVFSVKGVVGYSWDRGTNGSFVIGLEGGYVGITSGFSSTGPFGFFGVWDAGIFGLKVRWLPVFQSSQKRWLFFLPVWIPLLATAIPAAVLWWRDRRPVSERREHRRNMRQRAFRSRRILVRCGRTAALLLLVIWIATMNIQVGYASYASGTVRSVELCWGCLAIADLKAASPPPQDPSQGWYAVSSYGYWHIVWLPCNWRGVLFIPLWIPLLLLAIPTAYLWGQLWWRTRPVPAGYCRKCRYDLTGNTSGVCPECGEPYTERDTHMKAQSRERGCPVFEAPFRCKGGS